MVGRRRAGRNRASNGEEGGKGRRGSGRIIRQTGVCKEVIRVSHTHGELASANQ